ncbi:hypothetical protein INR49_001244 [Caranx melampygus]|nr:hypothetical protein INR49_001244 [Caranx melampygus]
MEERVHKNQVIKWMIHFDKNKNPFYFLNRYINQTGRNEMPRKEAHHTACPPNTSVAELAAVGDTSLKSVRLLVLIRLDETLKSALTYKKKKKKKKNIYLQSCFEFEWQEICFNLAVSLHHQIYPNPTPRPSSQCTLKQRGKDQQEYILMGMQVFDNVSRGKESQLMSRQLHRSAIKEQLAPFWVDMCHLSKGKANWGSPSFRIPKLDCRAKREDNSISVLAKHDTFRRQKQEMYFLPIIVTDNGNPPMSSTNTLTIRVCGCSTDGTVLSCNVEAYVLPIGLSMGALIAILACIILLLVIVVLFVTLRRHKNEPLIIKDDEDVRENIIRYDDEGGGEEDTEAFDIATLQNPDGINGYLPRKDIKPDLQFMPRAGQHSGPNGVDVDEFINVRLHEADNDPTAPPYDSIQIYGYEGRGSIAGSLSSLETASSDSDQNYDYLREWGPRFRRLGELYSVGESDRET